MTTTSSVKNYGQSIISSLNAGSGVDVKTLAQNLVDAEKAPQADAINAKLDKTEARITGYASVKFILDNLKSKFAALDDLGDFNSLSASNSQTTAFSAEISPTAASGNHSISVSQIAQGQRSISNRGYSLSDTVGPTTLKMNVGGTQLTDISISTGTSLSSLVSSINNQWSSSGISAQLVNKGDAADDPTQPYYLVISGPSGVSNSFSFSGLGTSRVSSSGFASSTSTLDSTTLNLSLSGSALSAIDVSAGTSISDVVNQINSDWGASGITARIIDDGDAAASPSQRYRIGIDYSGSGTMTFSGLETRDPGLLQQARNAKLTVDGVAVQSKTNVVTDVIKGIKLNLTGTTSGSASLNLTRNLDDIQTKIKALVDAYNDVNTVLNNAADAASTAETFGATLVGDSSVRMIKRQVRDLFFTESNTPSNDVKSLRDVGISVDRDGKMTLDDAALTEALQNSFEDVVKMLSASRSTPTTLKSLASGAAGEAVKKLSDLIGPSGMLATQTANAKATEARYKDQLSALEDRMSRLLDRYNTQFTAMETLINQINSTKSSLKSTFDSMLSSNNK